MLGQVPEPWRVLPDSSYTQGMLLSVVFGVTNHDTLGRFNSVTLTLYYICNIYVHLDKTWDTTHQGGLLGSLWYYTCNIYVHLEKTNHAQDMKVARYKSCKSLKPEINF